MIEDEEQYETGDEPGILSFPAQPYAASVKELSVGALPEVAAKAEAEWQSRQLAASETTTPLAAERYPTFDEIVADEQLFHKTIREQQLMEQLSLTSAAQLKEVTAVLQKKTATLNDDIAKQDATKSEYELMRHRNRNRPSVFFGAAIERTENGQYTASYNGISASGDSPDVAMDNFDHLWVNG